MQLVTRIILPEGRKFSITTGVLSKEGYNRLEKNGEFIRISDIQDQADTLDTENYHLLIDRMSCSDSKETISRLSDSAETAFLKAAENAACYSLPVTVSNNTIFQKNSRQTTLPLQNRTT